jgi:hypothetical protein
MGEAGLDGRGNMPFAAHGGGRRRRNRGDRRTVACRASALLAICLLDGRPCGGDAGAGAQRPYPAPRALRLRGGMTADSSTCSPAIRAAAGRSSLAGTGRVADLWDCHKFCAADDGMVAIFRHSQLGTAVELCETQLGLATFVENDARNATVAMAHGRMRQGEERRARGYTPLVQKGRTWWDVHEGFLAPDMLEALRDEAGQRPMVSEWFDVGEGSGWEAFDDGSQPYVRIANSDALCEMFLTENGFIFVGAPAGPGQPHKPQAVLVEHGQAAVQLTIDEARDRIAAMPPWDGKYSASRFPQAHQDEKGATFLLTGASRVLNEEHTAHPLSLQE